MLFGILQIYPSAIRQLATMICRVLIFDTQISAIEKNLTQGDTLIEGKNFFRYLFNFLM